MTFPAMVVGSILALFFTLIIVFLSMLRTGGDEAKLAKVPFKAPLITVAAVCLAAIGTQAVLTNLDAVRQSGDQRALEALVHIEASYSIYAGSRSATPFTDIAGGGAHWRDAEVIRGLRAGEKVDLPTASGTPATLQLKPLGAGSYHPDLIYGTETIDFLPPVTVPPRNTRGFPQFLTAG